MAADKGTISSKLTLDGEQEYKKALNDAYRTLRVLRSELKAESAELGKNASAQDKARVKTDSLKKQIEQQKKVVETLKKALEDSRKEYADNQDVQDKWEEKLNKAREALAKLQTQMEDANDELKGFSTNMKDAATDSSDAATQVVSLNDSIKSISTLVSGIGSGMSGVFTSTVSTMESMVDRMMELMGQAWSAAGEWKQIQSIWGGNVEDIEKVFTGAALQGVSSGDITSGIQKLVTNTHSGNKETIKALKQLGIEEEDYSNHWDYYMDVMQALADRDDDGKLTRAIFGDKTGSGQTDVVHNWNDMMSKYNQDVESTGLKLYEDEIEELDNVSHKITEVQELWNALKTNIGAKLVNILDMSGLSDDVLDILRTIASIFNETDETRKIELVETLDEQVTKLIDDVSISMENLGGWLKELGDGLSGSDNSLTAFIGQLMSKTGDLLDWLGENGPKIIEWMEAVLPWFLANKTSEALTGKGIGDWITDIFSLGTTIWQIKLLGTAFGGAAKGALAAEATGAALGSAIVSGLELAAKAVPWLAGLITLLTPGDTGTDDILDENGKLTQEAAENGFTQDDNGNVTNGNGPWEYEPTPEAVAADNARRQREKEELSGTKYDLDPEIAQAARERNNSFLELTAAERDAVEDYYDAIKANIEDPIAAGTMEGYQDTYNALQDLFTERPEEFDQIIDRIDLLLNNPKYFDRDVTPDDLPEEWFTGYDEPAEDIQESVDDLNDTIREYYDPDEDLYIEEIEEKVGTVEGLLRNLTADRYKGQSGTDSQVKIDVKNNVTTPVYLDGELIAQRVSEVIASQFGRYVLS